MQPGDIAFLCVAVGAITLFGGVLAWASFMEWRETGARQNRTETVPEIRNIRAHRAI
jgi:hypothetical protein